MKGSYQVIARNNKVQITNDLSWAFASGWIAGGSAVEFLEK